MTLVYDPAKRERTLHERGLDFARCEEVFAGRVFEVEDTRADYGEVRTLTYGRLDGRMVVVVWTDRGSDRRIISMRKANEREQARYAHLLG
ncbi:BrnT family toxin [Methylobacterium sp. SyP6R]|uniref:BrnT family toxin n=1 Tax=Methylobacterium sp. SyP6R TaxID=2718876 RepID=UPI001F33A590|nr:BrnT family toxin [Methylobacterium sp. SyP6R]MCF4127523.1 BrnT family toxin [Methylobacterium sp. SyP6R]